ncbi:3-isopropylmalate dehydratase large subunit [Paraburkholderia caballeronis]|uniref:3-isopropylmalate dehydratase, large subunit n=1 Tax=Paraburkholderia caballeronis TaxID=416943 RepID=A0A1H7MXA5_9BURK|nr:3-isopropylmalate dehydratase large subunit [Paraburkholderia caballeronis]PXW26365.1 3-isopropylmalate/(R)-2-methylmalate dehydratase large subunit [Paraburkholderia caballeronis]PXX01912.1 3-isopropylmalate/(R)-2-methylmalate dehydratase large subunit [Paraburkholderia caballeronis]RAK01069.1 3-isopropylmalate/(R)-2-methylmalate dehydratase large subunit [Paraburkholderia caballeronis]TDV16353.1 3-isopropylmalate/(R)-2-methylmalate dehydratase large subunit [Paraburkholderia caballeronis]
MAVAQTLAQKLIAAACGKPAVEVGEIVTCNVDLAMFHDSSGPRRLKPMLEALGAPLWDKSKIVLVMDHYVPEADDESRRIVRIARDWASAQQLPNVYDSVGICHVVLPERGHLRPGMLCVGGDSHSPTGGAFGAYMFGVGSTEMLGVVVSGQIWVKVPQTLRMVWHGRLARGVTAKDMMLHMIGRFGMNGGRYQAVEFCGDAVTALSMQERMTLSNMSAELGAQAGLIAPDDTTVAYLRGVGVSADIDVGRWQGDPGARAETHEFDAATLAPQVAAPHSPANTRDVAQFDGVRVQVAYIGACTGAKLDDLRAAASVLRGRRVADGVQLVVAPASLRDAEQAEREGVMAALRDAGAQMLATSCGACAGYGGSIPEGSTVISSTARNFKGRMGAASADVYLGSPYTVAASALTGRIADAREVLA